MIYKILADATVIIHFIWILFLFFGAFIGIKNRAVKIFHISGLVFAVVMQAFDWYCPLTHLEYWLKLKYNPALAYTGSFIIYYIERVVYLEISRTFVFVSAIFLAVFNLWIYSYFEKRKKRRKRLKLNF